MKKHDKVVFPKNSINRSLQGHMVNVPDDLGLCVSRT